MSWEIVKYVTVVAALFSTTLVAIIILDDERGRQINRAIFPAFKAIDRQCMAEEWPHETVGCKGALELAKSCHQAYQQAGYECTAREYYCNLVKLGFDLPPYWLETKEGDHHPCRSRWGWW